MKDEFTQMTEIVTQIKDMSFSTPVLRKAFADGLYAIAYHHEKLARLELGSYYIKSPKNTDEE